MRRREQGREKGKGGEGCGEERERKRDVLSFLLLCGHDTMK